MAVIGLENIAELEKAASVVARSQPLSPEESLELARVGLELAGTPEWKTRLRHAAGVIREDCDCARQNPIKVPRRS